MMIDNTALDGMLHAVAPHITPAVRGVWTTALLPPMRSSGITTPRRAAMFVGQVAVESDGFAVLVENLNYSAERLCEVWPSRFPDPDDPATLACAHNPQALADTVYAGRMGNGPSSTGDGWRFRGEGLIQLTGRNLDSAFAKAIGKTLNDTAAWMRSPEGAAASACWFWSMPTHRPALNTLADGWMVTAVTRAINGGTEGLPQRLSLCNAARQFIGG